MIDALNATRPLTPREKVELKPCPFCGGSPEMEFSEFELHDGFHVVCVGDKNCPLYCSQPYRAHDTEKEAAEVWNRRTALASGSGDHSELAKAIENLQQASNTEAWHWGVAQDAPDCVDVRVADLRAIMPILAENAALRAAKWEVKHVDTMNDMVLMGMARDDAEVRATEAERKLAEAVATLKEIAEIEPQPFDGGLDVEAIRTCDECQRYAGHPVQRGICNTHRRPIWDREKHESREEKSLGYRAKSIARTFLSKEAERG